MGLFVLPKKRNAGEMEYKHKLQRAREKLRLVREEPRVPGKSDGSAERNRSVRPEWRQMSGGFSRIPRRVAVFETPLRRNRLDNARFSATRFKMSDLPPLVVCIQTDAHPR